MSCTKYAFHLYCFCYLKKDKIPFLHCICDIASSLSAPDQVSASLQAPSAAPPRELESLIPQACRPLPSANPTACKPQGISCSRAVISLTFYSATSSIRRTSTPSARHLRREHRILGRAAPAPPPRRTAPWCGASAPAPRRRPSACDALHRVAAPWRPAADGCSALSGPGCTSRRLSRRSAAPPA